MVLAVEGVQRHYLDAEALLDRFACHLIGEGYARITVMVYKNSVHLFFAFLTGRGYPASVESINGADVDSFIGHVHRARSAGTAYTRYWGLKGFFDWQVSQGVIKESPVSHATQPRKPTKRSKGRIGNSYESMSASIKAA